MAWMILLAKESEIGNGCRDCRYLNNLKIKAECICDDRISVYKDGKIYEHRPYECPFRYYTDVRQITKQLHNMSEAETKGWFNGAQYEHENYKRLEEERDRFVGSETYRRMRLEC